MVPHFERACVEYFEANVDASNACLLLSQSYLFEELELAQLCLDIIDSKTHRVLQSDNFVDIDFQTLHLILGRETLYADETVVFTAATRWAKAECTRQGRDTSPQQCREVLGDALIRLPTMTPRDFANGAGQSGLLSQQEIIDIFSCFIADDKPELRFPTTHRWPAFIKSTRHVCRRFPLISPKDEQIVFGAFSPWEGVQFSVDKTIAVLGFGQYIGYEYCGGDVARYDIDIALKHDETVLCQKRKEMIPGNKSYSRNDYHSNQIVHVLFDHPCRIEANTFYMAIVKVPLVDLFTHHGVDGMCQVKCGGINFTFRDIDVPSGDFKNFTGVWAGMIPEIIFDTNHLWLLTWSFI